MTEKLKQILDKAHRYNSMSLAKEIFGLDENTSYDALVVAPSYTPEKILGEDPRFTIRELRHRTYTCGYELEGPQGLRLAWIQIASGGCNLLDHLLVCGELKVQRLIFLGAVGGLKPGFAVGDLCTPSYSVAGTLANTYLKTSLRDYVPFEKLYPDAAYIDQVQRLASQAGYELRKASVFCTDSIIMEYSHLEEIRAFGTDLIEMETASFYAVAQIMGLPAVALLVVSDNSAAGQPLIGRDEETQRRYHQSRGPALTELIIRIAQMEGAASD